MQAIHGHQQARTLLETITAPVLLFCGPEGIGRRSTARWYAAWLNCDGPEPRPCGNCASCTAFAADRHPDYREIAPAVTTGSGRTNRRPEIRIGQLVPRQGEADDPLGHWLERRPQHRRRIGVIDRAETLNPYAANAFLKFLEAPPSYATIVLIAPSPQSLLATVASRCTRIDFAPLDTSSYRDLAPHPGLRAGQIGRLERARSDPEGFAELQGLLHDYVTALGMDLERALEAADAVEKAWLNSEHDVGDLLREHLSGPAGAPVAVYDAIARCQEAISAYAHTPMALQRLTLELRRALRQQPG